MKMRPVLFAIAATLSCSTGALAGNATWNAEPSWSIGERSGAVHVTRNGAQEIAMREGLVLGGETVTTGPTGTAVLVRGDEFVMLAPNSRVRITVASEAASGGQIFTDAGKTVYRLKRKTLQDFVVKTPYFSALAHGTTFNVSVGADKASVQSVEGPVELTTSGGAQEIVKAGMLAVVSASNPAQVRVARSSPVALPTAAFAEPEAAPSQTASLFQR
jgi:hypothetical protein